VAVTASNTASDTPSESLTCQRQNSKSRKRPTLYIVGSHHSIGQSCKDLVHDFQEMRNFRVRVQYRNECSVWSSFRPPLQKLRWLCEIPPPMIQNTAEMIRMKGGS